MIDSTEFQMWLVHLERPGPLNDSDLDAILDPRIRAARALAIKAKSARRQTKQGQSNDIRALSQTSSSASEAGLITIKDVRALTKLGRSTLYRLMDDGAFPPPMRIGRSVRWPKSVIDEWIATRAEVDELGESRSSLLSLTRHLMLVSCGCWGRSMPNHYGREP